MSGRATRMHGTEVLATDGRQQYREKLARITLDSMVQFVSADGCATLLGMAGHDVRTAYSGVTRW